MGIIDCINFVWQSGEGIEVRMNDMHQLRYTQNVCIDYKCTFQNYLMSFPSCINILKTCWVILIYVPLIKFHTSFHLRHVYVGIIYCLCIL